MRTSDSFSYPLLPIIVFNEMLYGTHDCVFNNPHFTQTVNTTVGSGLEKLLQASMPEAFHDSAARDPPRCHSDTRVDYIDKICSWSSSDSQYREHILWMQGPAGVGKSAIAQSCAEFLAKQNRLGAAFFFSRLNNREDPVYLFTSISYQIATKTPTYGNIVDQKIRNDPTLVNKSITSQFDELLVRPLEELQREGGVEGYTIIIDGLDECAGAKAQREIIETVAKSVRDNTTPFRWAFFSRPESHIAASFESDRVHPLSLHLELPVSRETDHEILCYLVAEFKRIREEHNLPLSWPSQKDLGTLVDQSAGLFIYASTVIRFVGERNSSGPVDQLHQVLLLTKQGANSAGSDHPLSSLDLVYALIMRRVPSKILPTIQKILLLQDVAPHLHLASFFPKLVGIANILGLSEMQLRNACTALGSVLKLYGSWIRFYHASFMDFLKDPQRSKEFCIYGDCLDTVRQELLERLNHVHARSTDRLAFDLTWTSYPNTDEGEMYRYLANIFLFLCQYPRPLTPSTAIGLVKLQFQALPRLFNMNVVDIHPEELRQNIPVELRDKVIRRSFNPVVYFQRPRLAEKDRPYILGQGKNRVVCWRFPLDFWDLYPYPSISNF